MEELLEKIYDRVRVEGIMTKENFFNYLEKDLGLGSQDIHLLWTDFEIMGISVINGSVSIKTKPVETLPPNTLR